MLLEAPITQQDAESLRIHHYNATVISLRHCHEDLMVMRVKPDCGFPDFSAGQYTVLGLGSWEPRLENCQPEEDHATEPPRLIKRAYSVSCPIVVEEPAPVVVQDLDFLEFYITLVRQAKDHAPALTPRLFGLTTGDRIFVGPRFHGRYTLRNVDRDADLVFAATGTGEAPHNAMVAQLLRTGHRGRIANVTCVRWKKDLGYLATHRRVESMAPNYRYRGLTTREPENLDPSRPDFVGKRYLQHYFASGDLESETNVRLDPSSTHVFLCGNPDMIGAPVVSRSAPRAYAYENGVVELLENRGFCVDRPHEPGNIHFETYF